MLWEISIIVPRVSIITGQKLQMDYGVGERFPSGSICSELGWKLAASVNRTKRLLLLLSWPI